MLVSIRGSRKKENAYYHSNEKHLELPQMPFDGGAALCIHLQQPGSGFMCFWSLTECPSPCLSCNNNTHRKKLPSGSCPCLCLPLCTDSCCLTSSKLSCSALSSSLLCLIPEQPFCGLPLSSPFAASCFERSQLGLTSREQPPFSGAVYRVHLTPLGVCWFLNQSLSSSVAPFCPAHQHGPSTPTPPGFHGC